MIPSSELILNPDGSIYHLNIRPEHIAHDIITVGDPDRVDDVSKKFDSIEFTTQKREFKTTTGLLSGKRLTVISTGIGTDNIDIVFNELDALVNIDLDNRIIKPVFIPLRFYRIGTSGSIRPEIEIDSTVISEYAIGLDGLMHFYDQRPDIASDVIKENAEHCLKDVLQGARPYVSKASQILVDHFDSIGRRGITITATGFYAPQGRVLRYKPAVSNIIERLSKVNYNGLETTNLEMETAGIYGMSNILGHQAISINAIMANRKLGLFSTKGSVTIDKLIDQTLEKIITLTK